MDVKQAEQAVSSHPVGIISHANGHAEQARPVRLNGSCHCGECSYNCETRLPYPFMVCHCVACRKTGGTACVNLAADRHSPYRQKHDWYPVLQVRWEQPLHGVHGRHVAASAVEACKACRWVLQGGWGSLPQSGSSAGAAAPCCGERTGATPRASTPLPAALTLKFQVRFALCVFM